MINDLDSEINLVKNELTLKLDEEKQQRLDSEAIINDKIIVLNERLDSEAQTRYNEDNLLRSSLESEVQARQLQDAFLEAFIDSELAIKDTEIQTLNDRLDSEAALRVALKEWTSESIRDLRATKQDLISVDSPLKMTDGLVSLMIDSETLYVNNNKLAVVKAALKASD